MRVRGLVSFACVGTLLLFSLSITIHGAQGSDPTLGPLISGLLFGFTTFLFIRMGLSQIIETARASQRRD